MEHVEHALDTLRVLLGVQGMDQDRILLHCLETCEGLVLDYCNLESLPKALTSVVYDMAIDQYRMSGYGRSAAPTGAVAQMSEGEQSVSFMEASRVDASGLLKNYAARLNAHRKLRW